MHRRTIVIATILLILMGPGLFATDLSLEQALSLARANNGTLKVADLILKQTLRKGEENSYLPSISLEGTLSAKASVIDSTISTTYSVGSIDFTRSSADKYEQEQLSLASEIGMNSYQNTLNTVENKVTAAYWNLAASNLALEELRLLEKQQQRTLSETEERYENGLATTLAVNQAKLALSDAQISLQKAEAAVETATDNLNMLLGTEGDWELDQMPAVAEPIGLDELLSLAGNTTTAKDLSYAVKQAELSLQSGQQSAYGPTVRFSASTGLSGSVNSSGSSFSDATTLGVSVSVPLDTYLKNSSSQIELDSLEYAVQIARASYDNGMATLRSSVKSAYAALLDANASLEILIEHQELARQQMDLVQASYDAGQSSFGDLEESMDELQQSKLAVLEQQLQCTLSLYDLCYLLETDPSVITNTK